MFLEFATGCNRLRLSPGFRTQLEKDKISVFRQIKLLTCVKGGKDVGDLACGTIVKFYE